jgi:Tol biopolymer transport system component
MTTFERFEREIPSLMDEIAPPRLPDYLDDMLQQTDRTRQRPAWASLERWLPMDVAARPTVRRAPALRPLLILLLIGLLIAGGVLLYAGSQRTRLPAPFGPARNGVIVGTVNEDIVAFDPVTGSTTALIGGATRDIAPWFSRDGQRFMFVRVMSEEVGAYWVANADGSDAHELVPAPVDWMEWSDAGDRIVVTRSGGDTTETSVVDVASGTSTPLNVEKQIYHPFWRPGHDEIAFSTSRADDSTAYYLVNADGTGVHEIDGVSPFAIDDPQFSPDGSTLTYASYKTETGTQGRINALDIDSGANRVLMFEGSERADERSPRFSPDGSKLVFERYSADPPYGDGFRLVVAPADGIGPVVPIGPVHGRETAGAAVEFSPDGTQILAVYNDDGAAWLLPVDGSGEQRLDWANGAPSWQRLAP